MIAVAAGPPLPLARATVKPPKMEDAPVNGETVPIGTPTGPDLAQQEDPNVSVAPQHLLSYVFLSLRSRPRC